MKLRVPYYYDNFRCIAGACKDNCCIGGWEIDIDDETYEKYQHLDVSLSGKLRDNIVMSEDGEHCFRLTDGKCPMLTDDGLCMVHKELGEEYLGVVCNQFPRYSEYYGTIKESGVGMACEEAARIMLSDDKHCFELVEYPLDEEYDQDSEYDSSYASKIMHVRDIIFQILSLDTFSIHEKLIIILSMGSEIQECINEGDYDRISDVIVNYSKEKDYGADILDDVRERYDNGELESISLRESIRDILVPYEEMEVLSDSWNIMLKDIINSLYEDMSDDEYGILSDEFSTYMTDRVYEYRKLLEYFVYRYFAKSIYDYDVLGKCQMLISNLLVIRQMDMLRWMDNHKNYSFNDRMDIIHIFSRQVEYSEENIDNLYEDFIFDDIFNVDSLINILWLDNEIM